MAITIYAHNSGVESARLLFVQEPGHLSHERYRMMAMMSAATVMVMIVMVITVIIVIMVTVVMVAVEIDGHHLYDATDVTVTPICRMPFLYHVACACACPGRPSSAFTRSRPAFVLSERRWLSILATQPTSDLPGNS